MITAVKAWHAVSAALLLFAPAQGDAAEDAIGAARELARKTTALVGKGEPVSVSWTTLSSFGSSALQQARAAFETAIKEGGARISDIAPLAEGRITVSENRTQYLMIEEIRKGDERQVWIASWKRAGGTVVTSNAISLDRKLVWEQAEPMLDVAFPGTGMLVLSPSKVVMFARQNGGWIPKEEAPIAPARGKSWPRDLRGRLRLNRTAMQIYLPGVLCSGTTEPGLTLDCRASEEPWVLESGSRSLLLASFASSRNYFDGRVTTQSGARKNVPPFYSAAAVDDQGRTAWVLATFDGRTQIFDASWTGAPVNVSWGSDIAGTDARCGGGTQVLATRPGDAAGSDALQAFSMVNRAPVALTAPVEFAGPITALWPVGGNAVTAVVRHPAGKYEAWQVTVVCGE